MNFNAALLLLSFLMAVPAQAQQIYNDKIERVADDRFYGVPILDPKLELLINDVDFANYRAVDFHNKKFVTKIRKYLPLEGTWMDRHTSLVSRWESWDDRRHEWFRKKKVEASASAFIVGGVRKIRDMATIEIQNKTILSWKSVLIGVDQLNESKVVIEGLGDLDDLWSEFLGRIDKLDKAVRKLSEY